MSAALLSSCTTCSALYICTSYSMHNHLGAHFSLLGVDPRLTTHSCLLLPSWLQLCEKFRVNTSHVPSSRRFWVVVVVVHPHGFSCAMWSCRHSRVRVVGGHSCLRALHPSSSSLASSCIISVCCCHASSSSRVLGIACPCRHCVSSPCHCLMPSSSLSCVAVVAVPLL